MVCKSFLRFRKEDRKSIFKSACCLFIHQKMELTMDKDVGPQREKMLMELDKFAKTASDMINKQSNLNENFDSVINIKDRFNVNSFLKRRQLENPEIDYSLLNSIFIDHMFARTDNPTDSSISTNYIERVHEAAYILQKISKSIEIEKKNDPRDASKPNLHSVKMRIENLIELINAEKFDFEDVEAWRMGAIMENMFQERWRIRSDELRQLRIEIFERIQAGEIVTEGGLDEIVQAKHFQIREEETTAIKAISDTELEPYFRNKLINQLKDQAENVSRNILRTLRSDFMKHQHNIAKEEGKFSDREVQRKIMERINNMTVVDKLTKKDAEQRFEEFWNSEDVINSHEIKTLRDHIEVSNVEQKINYKTYLMNGFRFALRSLNYEISVLTVFPTMDSIYHWIFDLKDFKSINVMADELYFEPVAKQKKDSNNTVMKYIHIVGDEHVPSHSETGYRDRLSGRWVSDSTGYDINTQNNNQNQSEVSENNNGVWQTVKATVKNTVRSGLNLVTGNSSNSIVGYEDRYYSTFMSELYAKFDKSINDNPQTQRNFDGTADQAVITELCIGFKTSIDELALKYKISKYIKQHFIVICVVFASYKMLLRRLNENSDQSSKKHDPVKQLNMKKEYYKKLFILKMEGAQTNQIWQQQIGLEL